MTKYDYIFLDFDGTVLDGRHKHYQCYKDILREFGGRPIDLDNYWEMKRNRTDRKKILELSEFSGDTDDYIRQWKMKIEQKEYLQYDVLQQNAMKAIKILQKRTKHLYLLTMRQNIENLNWQLKQLHIAILFEKVICGANNENQSKYDMIKDILFENALFIGDTEADKEVAERCNSEFRGVLNGLRNEHIFRRDKVFSDLYQLALNL